MNDYWIHYTGKNGDDCTTGVTERTMDSARRAFTVAHEGADIQCIVLLGKHTYTNKQKESSIELDNNKPGSFIYR